MGQKNRNENRRMERSSQENLNRESEEDTEGKRRNIELGKERKMIGGRKEAKGELEYLGMTQELRCHALTLLEDAETVRLKTKTMQGGLSGILKDRIIGLRGVLECLIEKLEDKD